MSDWEYIVLETSEWLEKLRERKTTPDKFIEFLTDLLSRNPNYSHDHPVNGTQETRETIMISGAPVNIEKCVIPKIYDSICLFLEPLPKHVGRKDRYV